MTPTLLRPQGVFKPADALKLAQQAPAILRSNPKAFSSSPLSSLFTAAESAEIWVVYENLLMACLRTGDDTAAHDCLERLVRRFGDDNARIMALKGLVKEAEAADDSALEAVLQEYKDILEEDPANIAIAKRRVVVLRSLNRIADAVSALTALLDISPTDAEAWAELSDLYLSQGLYSPATYALEQVLVLAPHSWNMHARLGELLLMAATASPESEAAPQQRAESLKRFCRSVELCDNYLRGYYGLKLVTDKLLESPPKTSPRKPDANSDLSAPDQRTIERLNELATEKLAEIVRRHSAGDPHWQGYDEGEIAAAVDLLERATTKIAK